METNIDSFQQGDNEGQTERPEFLKIICIFSFVGIGLMILLFGLGSLALTMNPEAAETAWPNVIKYNPKLENVDPVLFFNEAGKISLYYFFANIFSLLGVIMMWRLERTGFFIYVLAELITHFFKMNIDLGEDNSSILGLILSVGIDMVFIVMYFINLKHMHKKQIVL